MKDTDSLFQLEDIYIYLDISSAARKAKEPHSNGINNLYTRSSSRGITQVPEQLSSLNIDHEMEDEEEMHNDEEDHHSGTDNDQQQPTSPTVTNGSDGLGELTHHVMNEEDEQQQQPQQNRLTHQRKRMLPMMNHRRPVMNGKSDLLSVRSHLEIGKKNRNKIHFVQINFHLF